MEDLGVGSAQKPVHAPSPDVPVPGALSAVPGGEVEDDSLPQPALADDDAVGAGVFQDPGQKDPARSGNVPAARIEPRHAQLLLLRRLAKDTVDPLQAGARQCSVPRRDRLATQDAHTSALKKRTR